MLSIDEGGVSGRFVQLGWPWVEWPGAARLPEGIGPPDGLLAGLLARNALARGAFCSAAGQRVGEVWRVEPVLGQAQRMTRHPAHTRVGAAYAGLQARVSLIGPTPRGMALLSDVTTSGEARWRQGNVVRVFAVVLRALWSLGRDAVFEPSGPQVWDRVRTLVEMVLHRLWEVDGLDGKTPGEAFSVVCDRSTMSQNDLDAGRLVAVVSLRPAASIEQITVHLVLDEGGRVIRLDPVATGAAWREVA
jgi:phage tail sheath protein FI